MKFGIPDRPPAAVKLSILGRCAMLIAATVFIVVALMSKQSADLAARIAVDGVVNKATSVNLFLSAQSTGGIRFGQAEVVLEALTSAADLSPGMMIGALAVDRGGNAIASVERGARVQAMSDIARRAIADGSGVVGEGGLLRADPVLFGPENQVIGAVVTQWSAETLLASASVANRVMLMTAAGLLALALGGNVYYLRRTVSAPLRRVGASMKKVVAGDHHLAVPETGRRDEIGLIARDLEFFRGMMSEAADATRSAVFQSAAFRASSAPMILADGDFTITLTNAAFDELAQEMEEDLRKDLPDFSATDVIGRNVDIFHRNPARNRTMIAAPGALPMKTDLRFQSRIMQIGINGIENREGENIGYVVEWTDVTEIRRDAAVLKALEAKQVRVQFDKDGAFAGGSNQLDMITGGRPDTLAGQTARDIVKPDTGSFEDLAARLKTGDAVVGRFELHLGTAGTRLIDGSFCPIVDIAGRPAGSLLLGLDITEQDRALAEAERARARMQQAQERVVDALRSGLARLREGDLTFRLADPLNPEYEQLREDFNATSRGLHDTVVEVSEMAAAMRGEVQEIVGAADELSRRTEQQAATLEETAAAVAQITAAVTSAAEGARRATEVVTEARGDAESSGTIVGDAVAAMDEISSSSDQISKIIGVIDDIAFQTNLLALNAGVEAARAGDAGRGFAVVASEVRALAQRSSEAAREINGLITTSGQHVKSGAQLVGQAGDALRKIAGSVTGISDHVTEIVSSSQEQSASLAEVNTAMGQLDQVTQQNAAMFEETTAASHALVQQAERLATGMARFRVTQPPSRPAASAAVAKTPPVSAAPAKQAPAIPPSRSLSNGALALDPGEEDWADF